MAERLSLELELLEKVGGPAKKAAAALRSVELQAKKASSALDFSKELSRTKDQLNKIKLDPKGYHDLIKAQKALREEREKMKKSLDSHGGLFSSFKSGLKEHLGLDGMAGKMAKASFWGHLGASAVVGIGEGFIEGAHKAVEIVYDGMKEAFGAIAKEQERVAGYDLTLGKKGSGEAREDIERFSKQTAFSASQNMDMMLPLFRAGLKGQDARTMYAASLDLAAGRGKGSDQGAVNDAVELFAKIQQKGGVTTKQLAGVGLGETNIPAFFKDLGKSLHITAKEAEKRAATPGGIDPQILRNSIVMAIEKQQGGQAGTGAEKAGSSLFGMWNKLKELPEDFFEKLVNSPAIPRLTKMVGDILEKLSPDGPIGKRIIAGLEKMFDKLSVWVSDALSPENIDGFINAVAKIPEYLSTALSVIKELFAIATEFAVIWTAGKLIDGIGGMSNLMKGMSFSISGMREGLNGALSPVAAITIAFEAWRYAFKQISETIDKLGGVDAVIRDVKDFFDPSSHPAEAGGAANRDLSEEMDRQNKINVERAHALQRMTHNNVNVGGVTIVAAPGEDPTHTHQKAGNAVAGFTLVGMEKAAAEGGG